MKVSINEQYVKIEEGTQGVDQRVDYYDLTVPNKIEALKKRVGVETAAVFVYVYESTRE